MNIRRKGADPRGVLHNLCRDFEIPATDIPQQNLTRVRLRTQTQVVNTAVRFDNDLNGFQHYTPLARVRPEDRGAFAESAIRNPPREITPVLNSEGLAGIQGAKSNLPRTKTGIEGTFLDVFGRISNYVDRDFPNVITELKKR
jgi:hypothetical protein